MYTFKPTGVCAKEIRFDIRDGLLSGTAFTSGCPGNLRGIAKLVEGMPVDEVIGRLKGITCGKKNTSCPDQLCKALEEWKQMEASREFSAA